MSGMRHHTGERIAHKSRHLDQLRAVGGYARSMVAGVYLDESADTPAVRRNCGCHLGMIRYECETAAIGKPRCPVEFFRCQRGRNKDVTKPARGKIFGFSKSRYRDTTGFARNG